MNQADVLANNHGQSSNRLTRSFITSILISTACFGPMAYAATYEVQELSTSNLAINTFARALDEQDNALVVAQDVYNLPIDFGLIDFTNENIITNLTDLAAAEAGNPNAADYRYLIGLIRFGSSENSLNSQHLALYQSYVNNGVDDMRVIGFDEQSPATDGFTFSAEVVANDFLNSGTVVGSGEGVFSTLSATFTADDDTQTQIDYVINDFTRRGFVQMNGVTTGLVPSEAALGGISEAYGINANLQVVGSSSTRMTSQLVESIALCDDDEERGELPVEVCYRNIALSGALTSRLDRRATIWQLDSQGQVISSTIYPLPFTPAPVSEENLDTAFYNAAFAINDAGIAVGETHTFYAERELKVSSAAIYQDDQTIEFINKDDYFPSTALDINNNNWVIGTGNTSVNGTTRTKFYAYNIDTETLVFPDDFFPGSSSVARSINDNNIIVGEGEVEFENGSTRRKHAFMYDMNTETFTNLNDLLSCNSPYTIVGANAINNNDIILANALVNRQARDAAGELAVDADGEAIMIDQVIAVRLHPVSNGQVDDCSSVEDDTVNERQGASVSIFSALFLGLMSIGRGVFWRRRQTFAQVKPL